MSYNVSFWYQATVISRLKSNRFKPPILG